MKRGRDRGKRLEREKSIRKKEKKRTKERGGESQR